MIEMADQNGARPVALGCDLDLLLGIDPELRRSRQHPILEVNSGSTMGTPRDAAPCRRISAIPSASSAPATRCTPSPRAASQTSSEGRGLLHTGRFASSISRSTAASSNRTHRRGSWTVTPPPDTVAVRNSYCCTRGRRVLHQYPCPRRLPDVPQAGDLDENLPQRPGETRLRAPPRHRRPTRRRPRRARPEREPPLLRPTRPAPAGSPAPDGRTGRIGRPERSSCLHPTIASGIARQGRSKLLDGERSSQDRSRTDCRRMHDPGRQISGCRVGFVGRRVKYSPVGSRRCLAPAPAGRVRCAMFASVENRTPATRRRGPPRREVPARFVPEFHAVESCRYSHTRTHAQTLRELTVAQGTELPRCGRRYRPRPRPGGTHPPDCGSDATRGRRGRTRRIRRNVRTAAAPLSRSHPGIRRPTASARNFGWQSPRIGTTRSESTSSRCA